MLSTHSRYYLSSLKWSCLTHIQPNPQPCFLRGPIHRYRWPALYTDHSPLASHPADPTFSSALSSDLCLLSSAWPPYSSLSLVVFTWLAIVSGRVEWLWYPSFEFLFFQVHSLVLLLTTAFSCFYTLSSFYVRERGLMSVILSWLETKALIFNFSYCIFISRGSFWFFYNRNIF